MQRVIGKSAADFHADQRGAIMMMGLVMSCFLIGSLWFLIGIGNAIVARDYMQEATDHAAFTAAVLHAKGMNFISACNLILLVLIAVHIILGLIRTVAGIICIISLGFGCGFTATAQTWYMRYGNVFKKIATGIHWVEVGAAYGYPFIGMGRGFFLGSEYGNGMKRNVNMLVASPSMVPGPLINWAVTGNRGNGSPKMGLPVQAAPFKQTCARIGDVIGQYVIQPLTSNLPFGGTIGDALTDAVKEGITFMFCNDLSGDGAAEAQQKATDRYNDSRDAVDKENKEAQEDYQKKVDNQKEGDPTPDKPVDLNKPEADKGDGGFVVDPGFDPWWGQDGPLVPWGATSNGSPWQSVWAMNISPDMKDNDESKVAIGGRIYGSPPKAAPSIMYTAQAEFYFDCTEVWSDNKCDGADYAGYSLRWTARLRKMDAAPIGTLIGSFSGDLVTNLDQYTGAQSAVKDAITNTIIREGVSMAFNALDGKIKETLTNLGASFDPKSTGVYH